LSTGEHEYTWVMKADSLGTGSLKIPSQLKKKDDEPQEVLYERMMLVSELEAILEALWSDFLSLRLSEAWEDVVMPALRRFAHGKKVDEASYLAGKQRFVTKKKPKAGAAPTRSPEGGAPARGGLSASPARAWRRHEPRRYPSGSSLIALFAMRFHRGEVETPGAESGHAEPDGREPEVGRREARPCRPRAPDEAARRAVGHLVPKRDLAELRARGDVARGDDLVERGHAVTGADLACVLAVVGEVLVGEDPVLVADEAERLDGVGVERDLDLHVLGDGVQGARRLLDQDLLRPAVVDVRSCCCPLSASDPSCRRGSSRAELSTVRTSRLPSADQHEVGREPTLKSPSVARMTRFVPPLMKPFSARLYASSIPAAPFVEPPAGGGERRGGAPCRRRSSTTPDAPA
jgi:hypothetical protein